MEPSVRETISFSVLALALSALPGSIGAQQPSQAKIENGSTISVYRVGNDVAPPVLLPQDFSSTVVSDCKSKKSGSVELQAVIDEHGVLHNISFIKATGTDLDRFALDVALSDRFTPATRSGVPVAVGEKIEIKVKGCLEKRSGNAPILSGLAEAPIQKAIPFNDFPDHVIFARSHEPVNTPLTPDGSYRLPDGVKPPVPIYQPQAEYTDEARDRHIEGEVLIRMTIDVHGLPTDRRVVRPLGFGLDGKALEAAMRYRFKPAMKDGVEPVPVTVTVAVHFQFRG
jgi:TonB family protein